MRSHDIAPHQTLEFLRSQATPQQAQLTPLQNALPPQLWPLLSGQKSGFEPPRDEVIRAGEAGQGQIRLGPGKLDFSEAHNGLMRFHVWSQVVIGVFILFMLVFLVRSCGVLSMNPPAAQGAELRKASEPGR